MGPYTRFFLFLRYAILQSLYCNNKKFYDLFKRPILSLFEKVYHISVGPFNDGFSNNELIPIYSHIYV